MPGLVSPEMPSAPQSITEKPSLAEFPQAGATPVKKSMPLKRVLAAVKPWVMHPGEQMKSFLGALKQDELAAGQPQGQTAGTESANVASDDGISAQEWEAKLPISESSRRFLRTMNRPSIVTKIIASRMADKPSDAQIKEYVVAQNSQLLSKFLGEDVMDRVERNEADLDKEVAAKVRKLDPLAFRAMVEKLDEEDVFAMRRLENALRANGATRDAAKMLRQLRKASGYTIPRLVGGAAWKNREILAGMAIDSGKKVIGGIGRAAGGIASRVKGVLGRAS